MTDEFDQILENLSLEDIMETNSLTENEEVPLDMLIDRSCFLMSAKLLTVKEMGEALMVIGAMHVLTQAKLTENRKNAVRLFNQARRIYKKKI